MRMRRFDCARCGFTFEELRGRGAQRRVCTDCAPVQRRENQAPWWLRPTRVPRIKVRRRLSTREAAELRDRRALRRQGYYDLAAGRFPSEPDWVNRLRDRDLYAALYVSAASDLPPNVIAHAVDRQRRARG